MVRQRLDKHTCVSVEGGRGLCFIWEQEEGEVGGVGSENWLQGQVLANDSP